MHHRQREWFGAVLRLSRNGKQPASAASSRSSWGLVDYKGGWLRWRQTMENTNLCGRQLKTSKDFSIGL